MRVDRRYLDTDLNEVHGCREVQVEAHQVMLTSLSKELQAREQHRQSSPAYEHGISPSVLVCRLRMVLYKLYGSANLLTAVRQAHTVSVHSMQACTA